MKPARQQRAGRVADAIRAEIADLLRRGLKDPRVGFVTLTGVEVTADLRHAKVFYSVVGDAAEREATRKGLRSAGPYLQGEVGRRLRLRNTPTLEFRYDESLERGARIERLLREVQGDPAADESAASPVGPPTPPPDGPRPPEAKERTRAD